MKKSAGQQRKEGTERRGDREGKMRRPEVQWVKGNNLEREREG